MIRIVSALFALSIGLIACSQAPVVSDFPDTANATSEVNKLDTNMNNALKEQVNVLSPQNFEDAQDALISAKKSLANQKEAKDTLHKVALGNAYLARSIGYAQVAHNNIEDVISARSDAIKAGAHETFSSDFSAADQKLKYATLEIEKNNTNEATRDRAKIQKSYLDLELKAIKQTNLGESHKVIALAVKEGAEKFAPRSLSIAQKSANDTEAYIIANRHEAAVLSSKSNETKIQADHLLKITRISKIGDKTSNEDTALLIEKEQNKVSDKQSQLNNSEKQLEVQENSKLALIRKNKSLESDQDFNRSFEAARVEFSESEAEVYKQGNTLIIRLRGLEFPSAKTTLKGSDFPLLAKVQKVINDFGKSTIIVEGHTDSVGGKALNQTLSTNRALVVKEYLISNAGSDSLDIQSVGYDYQKPLATNKTALGRAQNRRVDILINAEIPGKL